MEKLNIPILDLKPEIDELWDELNAAIQGVLRTGHFIMGPNVQAFEQEVAQYLGVKHAIGLNSGTDALVIALRALGIGEGHEVITTPFTFFATAEAISSVGATPIFVDIDPRTFNIDPNLIEPAITKRTKAILPVHLYGQAADMDPILALAKAYNLKVVEDVAQAFGGSYKGRKNGTMGDVGCYSFFPTKNLGAYGDGGLLTTDNDEVAEMARMLRAHGSKKKYFNEVVGYNSRLDEIQAAILRVKLPHLDHNNEARRLAARRYGELLQDVPGIVPPFAADYAHHVYHQYTVRVIGGERNRVQRLLDNAGVGTMIYYPTPVHLLPIYQGQRWALPQAERLTDEVLSIPIWPQLLGKEQAAIVQAVKGAMR